MSLLSEPQKPYELSSTLTLRQTGVAAMVCQGHSNRIVARNLKLTEGTVKIHLHAIFRNGIDSEIVEPTSTPR